jgi:hypothetical protein
MACPLRRLARMGLRRDGRNHLRHRASFSLHPATAARSCCCRSLASLTTASSAGFPFICPNYIRPDCVRPAPDFASTRDVSWPPPRRSSLVSLSRRSAHSAEPPARWHWSTWQNWRSYSLHRKPRANRYPTDSFRASGNRTALDIPAKRVMFKP